MIGAISRISGYSSYNYQPISYSNAISNAAENGALAANVSIGDNARETAKSEALAKALGTDKDAQTGIDDPIAKASGKVECQACKNRKYVDGSDEMVSFKSPAKISAGAAYSRVSAHEQEHVANAYNKAEKDGGKVLQASVAIKTAICPECGKSYIAGGTTTTRIAYPADNNPYSKNQKANDYGAVVGSNFDSAV